MKKRLFIAMSLGLLAVGCRPSGFSTLNFSSPDKGSVGIEASAPAASAQPTHPASGQPGSITLAGALVQKEASGLKPAAKIKISQVQGDNKPGINPQLYVGVETHHLNQVEIRNDAVVVGCNQNQAEVAPLIRGLKPAPTNFELKEFLDIKAKVVVLCGRVSLSQAFISIVADQLILLNFGIQIANPNGVGSFSAMAKKITLVGQNSIASKGLDSAGAIIDGPSIYFYAQNELLGSGTLDLKTFGGNRLVSVGK